MHTKIKPSGAMIILAIVTLALSSWGMFKLAHVYGGVPAWLAIMSVAGLDLFAVAAGKHALVIAEDGDSPAIWNATVVGVAALSAVLQFAVSRLENHPWPVGLLMAMFPLATIALFEGTLRRAHRLQGRQTGRVAPPRAHFELVQWAVFPRATASAFRFAVGDRRLGGDAAFKLGLLATRKPEAERPYVPPARVEVPMPYDQLIDGYPTSALDGGAQRAIGADSADSAAASADDGRTVSALVTEAIELHGADSDAVSAHVLRAKPGANPETVRKTFGRLSRVRAVNE